MAKSCANCGASVADEVRFCPNCGASITSPSEQGYIPPPPRQTAGGGLQPNIVAMLCYITIIPAIIFLLIEPYNKDRLVRFHAFQSIFFFVAWIVLAIVISMFASVPVLGWLIALMMSLLYILFAVLWLILLYKAYKSEMYKLPVIGDLAEKQV